MNFRVFTNNEFGQLKVIIKNNKEYIEAIQVARILGYSNPRDAVLRLCDIDGVVFSDVGVVTGKKLDNTESTQYIKKKFINEGNLYRLIVKSKLPSAKRFERWVMDEVLPSVRKHGLYMTEETINKTLDDPDFIIEMATKLKMERAEKIRAQEKAENLEAAMIIDKPYTNFGKSIASCTDTITIGQFAKILNNNDVSIGRNRLYSWFRENGYFIKNGKDKNIPKQIYVEQGLFKVSERVVQTAEGDIISTSTSITGKGQLYFIKRIIEDEEQEYIINNDNEANFWAYREI